MEVLESVSHSELDDVIEKVLDAVEKQPCKCSTVSFRDTLYVFFGVFGARQPTATLCLCVYLKCLRVLTKVCFLTVTSSMIELSVTESAVQDCSQSCDEAM